jgi:hypothetical protein
MAAKMAENDEKHLESDLSDFKEVFLPLDNIEKILNCARYFSDASSSNKNYLDDSGKD